VIRIQFATGKKGSQLAFFAIMWRLPPRP